MLHYFLNEGSKAKCMCKWCQRKTAIPNMHCWACLSVALDFEQRHNQYVDEETLLEMVRILLGQIHSDFKDMDGNWEECVGYILHHCGCQIKESKPKIDGIL